MRRCQARSTRRGYDRGRRPHHFDDGHRRRGAVAGRPHRREAGPAARRTAGADVRAGLRRGAAGVARLHDYLRGAPFDVAVLVSVELCSLTTKADPNMPRSSQAHCSATEQRWWWWWWRSANAVPNRSAPAVPTSWIRVAISTPTHCARWAGTSTPPDSRSFSAPTSAAVVERYLGDDVTEFLAAHGLTTDEVGAWVSHPGGPKVIEGDQRGPRPARRGARADLALTERSRQHFVGIGTARITRHDRQRPPSGSPGVLMAIGPDSVPNSCYCAGTDQHGLVCAAERRGRIGATGRTDLLHTQPCLEPSPWRRRVRCAALPGDVRTPHRSARSMPCRGDRLATARSSPHSAGRCWGLCWPPKNSRPPSKSWRPRIVRLRPDTRRLP